MSLTIFAFESAMLHEGDPDDHNNRDEPQIVAIGVMVDTTHQGATMTISSIPRHDGRKTRVTIATLSVHVPHLLALGDALVQAAHILVERDNVLAALVAKHAPMPTEKDGVHDDA